MTARALVREADVTRVLRGARKAGFAHVRLGIDRDGRMVVDASTEAAFPPLDEPRRNPLDRVLTHEDPLPRSDRRP